MICISKVRKFKQNYETTDFEKIMKIWVTSTFATNKERSVIDPDFHYIFFSGHSFFLTWLWNHPIKSMIGYCSNSKPHTLVLPNWHYQIGNSVDKVDITFFRHAIHSIRDWQKKSSKTIFFTTHFFYNYLLPYTLFYKILLDSKCNNC